MHKILFSLSPVKTESQVFQGQTGSKDVLIKGSTQCSPTTPPSQPACRGLPTQTKEPLNSSITTRTLRKEGQGNKTTSVATIMLELAFSTNAQHQLSHLTAVHVASIACLKVALTFSFKNYYVSIAI